jgi:formylglycine-generating enzyme required for sulfatase activity
MPQDKLVGDGLPRPAQQLYKQEYEKLTAAEREALLRTLADVDERRHFLRFERYARFGRQTETAVYALGDREFVFVPGDTVTLGWESFAEGMNDATRSALREELAEFGLTDVDAFLRDNMSPLRQVTIAPMLVEREVNSIGWRRVGLDSPELDPYRQDIAKHFKQSHNSFEIHNTMRMRREDGDTIAEMYVHYTYADFLAGIQAEGLALPTEDEWEYLCGGGSRALFRWGDSFDYEMKLRYFAKDKPAGDPYSLEQPNQFGLVIAHDPYQYEVLAAEYFLKGGDGGCNLCGGAGVTLAYLPVATYFRPCQNDDRAYFRDNIGGDYTFYRRLIRL